MELRHIIAARLRLLHKCACPWDSEHRPGRAYIGAYGELTAASYLRAKGLKVLRHGFRMGSRGEVDLVCREGDTLVFCEVKSSTSPASGAPARMVNREKRELLRTGAGRWMALLPCSVPYRFDVVEIYLLPHQRPIVEWTRNAFPIKERTSR